MVDLPANHDWFPEGTVHLCNRFGIPNQQRFCSRTNLDHWSFDIPCTGDAIPVSFRLFASPTNLVHVTLPTELQGGIPYRVYIYMYTYTYIYIYLSIYLPQILVIKKPTLKIEHQLPWLCEIYRKVTGWNSQWWTEGAVSQPQARIIIPNLIVS